MDDRRRFVGYAWAAAAVVACTLAGLAVRPRFDLVNVAMVYLLAVVVIALRFPHGDLPLVRVDATLVEQALGNLLENCAKHTPAGTVVRIRAERSDAELLVTVEDYGGGLSQDDLERVFAKFHHGAVEGGGTDIGLGLSICRAIVRLHGGRAWAERVPAGGTAFRFTLPLEEAPTVPSEAD